MNDRKIAEARELLASARAYHNHGNHVLAKQNYNKYLSFAPNDPDALQLLGVVESELGDHSLSILYLNRSLSINPASSSANLNLGIVQRRAGLLMDALESFRRAIAIRPHYGNAFNNMGVVLLELSRTNEALSAFNTAVELEPKLVDAHNNRAVALHKLGHFTEALHSLDIAIQLDPACSESWKNRCNTLIKLNRSADAITCGRKAIDLDPSYLDAYNSYGVSLIETGELLHAIEQFDHLLLKAPDDARAHMNRAIAKLALGDYETGWLEYEWRWRTDDFLTQKKSFPQPLWTGREDLSGKRILVYGEQGLGDRIQFSRYLFELHALGAEIIFEVPMPLIKVFEGLTTISILIESGDRLPNFDYHCPLLSLPKCFGTKVSDLPIRKNYLTTSDELINEWRQRLGASSKPRIGLAWSGSSTNRHDHARSIPLAEILPFLPSDFNYYCLQKDVRPNDIALLSNSHIVNFGEDLTLEHTAAVIKCLDLVISVDTSIAHLSAALGQQTWVMLPFSPDWRWLHQRKDSPWYPSITLYRQERPNMWEHVLTCIKRDLCAFDFRSQRSSLNQRVTQ